MSNYLKPQKPLYSKENKAYFYPLTTSDQVILPDGSRLNQEGLEGMITPEGIGALSMELLWENASPASEFVAQTIALDLSEYNSLLIIFHHYAEQSTVSLICDIGKNALATASIQFMTARVLIPGINGVEFKDCNMYSSYGSATTTVSNKWLVPAKIYGIKGVSA